jgi:2-methylcitrate dehydratase PrpD
VTANPLSLSRRLVRSLTALAEQPSGSEASFAQWHIRDTLAIAAAARPTPLGASAVRGATFGSSGGTSRIVGTEGRFPPATAAFANSALAHVLDFDDIHDPARLHPTTVAFPAALAAAEAASADGMSVVRGTLLGSELMCRLGMAASPVGSGRVAHWFLTQLFGALGAALAAGSALGLDEDGLVAAVGLAAMQAAGSKQVASSSGTARAIYPAFAAAAGVTAALLAAQDITAAPDSLEGRDGLLPVYLDDVAVEDGQLAEAITGTSGWAYLDTAIKPWPCCRISHPYVSAALRARRELGVGPDLLDSGKISEIVIDVNASAAKLCHPLGRRRAPESIQDAKYSIPFMTAHALRHGTTSLGTTTGMFFADEDVRRLAAAVSVAETLPDRPGHAPARIRIVTSDGQSVESQAEPAELSADGTGAEAKVVACLRAAAEADPQRAAQRLTAAVAGLPDLPAGQLSTFGALRAS